MTKREELVEQYPDESFVCMDGYDDAIIGIDKITRKVVYLESKCISALMSDGISNEEEAIEYFEYNTVRANAYMGKDAVIIVCDI